MPQKKSANMRLDGQVKVVDWWCHEARPGLFEENLEIVGVFTSLTGGRFFTWGVC